MSLKRTSPLATWIVWSFDALSPSPGFYSFKSEATLGRASLLYSRLRSSHPLGVGCGCAQSLHHIAVVSCVTICFAPHSYSHQRACWRPLVRYPQPRRDSARRTSTIGKPLWKQTRG